MWFDRLSSDANFLHISREKLYRHKGCKCPPEFEGEHCEYVKGMAPTSNKGSDAERAYIVDSVTVDAKFSPAMTSEHTKNSKELSAKEEEDSVNEAFVFKAPPAAVVVVASENDESKPSMPSHSKTSIDNSILQSISITQSQQTAPSSNTEISTPLYNHNSTPTTSNKSQGGSIFGLTISIMGITLFGTALLLRARRQRKLLSRIIQQHSQPHLASLDRNNYTDETPIRVRIMAEDEGNELELDEVLGIDDDVVSIGECSLEEIELEDGESTTTYGQYLRNISEEFVGSEDGDVSEDGGESSGSSSSYFPSIFA